MKGKYSPVPKTGQTTSYGTREDGALQKGVAWPTPRFTDNNNGTVTDKLTGLIWMKNADYFGLRTWVQALSEPTVCSLALLTSRMAPRWVTAACPTSRNSRA